MLNRAMFVGRYSAETCGPWSDFAMISIGEPAASEGDPVIQDGWHDVLRLSFHDVVPSQNPDDAYTLMTAEDAGKIVAFVRHVAPNVEGIIVHCRAGISRSAAVVKWIAQEYKIPFNKHYRKYNDFVWRLMVVAGQVKAWREEDAFSVFLAEPLKDRMITLQREGDTQSDVSERQEYLDIVTGWIEANDDRTNG